MRALELGRLLRARRTQLDLSRESVATAAGISTSTLAKLETGAVIEPVFFNVVQVAQVLGIAVDELVDQLYGGR